MRIIKEQTNQEYLNLKEHYASSSKSTISSYRNNYNKLYDALDETDITAVSEKTIIDAIDSLEISNAHTRCAIINIAVVVRSLPSYQLGVNRLTELRMKTTADVLTRTKEKNDDIKLPSYNELVDYMNEQYDNGNHRGYIINYLLINYQVRNQDLVFDIVKTKKEMKDKTKNYLWINIKGNTVIYQRNIYKTAKVYGAKQDIITDARFMFSTKHIAKLQNLNNINSSQGQDGRIIQNISSLPFYISKYCLNNLGEGRYCKIVVNHFRDNIDMINNISNNRGTNLNTLMLSYNIHFKNDGIIR
jgi:hypothetical protein